MLGKYLHYFLRILIVAFSVAERFYAGFGNMRTGVLLLGLHFPHMHMEEEHILHSRHTGQYQSPVFQEIFRLR